MIKLFGYERHYHKGPARVFDSEHEALEAVYANKINDGDVVVIRYEGPKGGPGMQEMLAITAGTDRSGTRRQLRAGHRRPLLAARPRD